VAARRPAIELEVFALGARGSQICILMTKGIGIVERRCQTTERGEYL